MIEPTAALTSLRASTAALVAGIEGEQWTDEDVRAPSLLPGWSRAHVLTHLARNADGIARTMSGALRGERVARYPHGRAGRDADIDTGARRASVELAADVRESAERLDRVIAAVAEADGWELPTEDRLCGEYVLARWREVEVHRLDLGGAYGAADWPAEFVSYLLPELAATVADRTSTALRIVVTPDGSTAPDLGGRQWSTAQSDDAVLVQGPDWAVLAWLVGSAAASHGRLTATPDLAQWI